MQLRTSETISFTDIQRRAKEIFESIETGKQEKYVILKNNEIAAVLLPVALGSGLRLLAVTGAGTRRQGRCMSVSPATAAWTATWALAGT